MIVCTLKLIFVEYHDVTVKLAGLTVASVTWEVTICW